jgi:sodium/proline symporter
MEFGSLAAFTVYFSALTALGIYFYRRSTKSAAQFISGSQSVNYWVTAIATQTSDMGAWLFLGFPAAMFIGGIFEYWTAIGLVTFMWISWTFIAPRLRYETGRYHSVTLADYFEKRYNDTSGILGWLVTVISLVFFMFYISSGIVALGRIFQAAFDIPYHTGIVVSIAGALFYTLLGGFVAIAWCDFFQGIFLLSVIVGVPLYAFSFTGGIQEIIAIAQQKNISLSLLSSPAQTIQAILLSAGWGLGYFGQPHILTNFMGIDDPTKIRAARTIGISWQIIVLTAAAFLGMVSIAFFKDTVVDPQMIFVLMTQSLFHPFVAGLALCAIFAATLSSVDTQLLIAGSLGAKQLNQATTTLKQYVSLITLSRLTTTFVACCAVAIAWHSNNSIYDLVYFAWSGLGAAFGPLTIASLYHKHVTRAGAIGGIIVGTLTAIAWPALNTGIMQLVPAFLASYGTILVVSALNTPKKK